MKWLNYRNQMVLGIGILTLGHILSWVTGQGFFRNLGWIGYGLLFLLHPVWLESAAGHPHIKVYVRMAGVVVIILGCMLGVGGEDDFWQSRISEALGVDVSSAAVTASYDDHSGFHGDGTMYAVLYFEDDRMEQTISAPGGWKALPLSENLTTLVYGKRTDTATYGPYIGATVSQIEEGYYFFYDRKNETFTDDQVLQGGSFNYTFAMYDTADNLLYYYEYDT